MRGGSQAPSLPSAGFMDNHSGRTSTRGRSCISPTHPLHQLSPDPLPTLISPPCSSCPRDPGWQQEALPSLATHPRLPLLLLGPHFILNDELDAGLRAQNLLQILLQMWGLGLGVGVGARETPRMEDTGQKQPHPDCLRQHGKEMQGRWPHIHYSEPLTGPPWTSRPWPQCTEGTLAGAPPHRPSNPHNAGNSRHPL